jgi:diguanylate cyclase (GGDEF)-like protein
MNDPIHLLKSLPKIATFSIALVLVAFIGVVDWLITIELSLSIFYLVPISVAAWFVSRQAGILVSILSAIAWWTTDVLDPYTYTYPAIAYWNALVRLGFFLIVTYLLSALKTAFDRERQLARTDGLTGVLNRRSFWEIAELEFQRSRRHQYPLTVAYLDIDNFKAINDRFGHATGDRILSLTAIVARNTLRATDTVARIGGDEFILLLPETNEELAQTGLHRLHQALLETVGTQHEVVTFSIGAVTFLSAPESVEIAIEQADRVMYDIKRRGKNQLEFQICPR